MGPHPTGSQYLGEIPEPRNKPAPGIFGDAWGCCLEFPDSSVGPTVESEEKAGCLAGDTKNGWFPWKENQPLFHRLGNSTDFEGDLPSGPRPSAGRGEG